MVLYPGIDVVLSNPFYLTVIESVLFFSALVSFTLNVKEKGRQKSGEKEVKQKLGSAADKYNINMSGEGSPLIFFASIGALMVYNIIAWFMMSQISSPSIDLVYEFYTGFVVFLLIWVAWTQLGNLLSVIFYGKYPVLDIKNHLKKRSGELILKYMTFSSLVYRLLFPLIVFVVVYLFYPRPFFLGILLVLIVGVIQNIVVYSKVSGASGKKK